MWTAILSETRRGPSLVAAMTLAALCLGAPVDVRADDDLACADDEVKVIRAGYGQEDVCLAVDVLPEHTDDTYVLTVELPERARVWTLRRQVEPATWMVIGERYLEPPPDADDEPLDP